jgi:hypothetical protein
MAAQRQPMQFAPESQLQTLSRIAPGINALRGVQQQQMEQERLSSEDAAFEQLRRGAQEVLGNPNATISDLARVVINNAKTPAQFDAGQKLLHAELVYRQRKGRLAEFFDQPMTANALLRMYAEDPEAAKLLEPQVLTPSQRTVPVGPNIFERDQSGSGRFITPQRVELPVSGVRLGAQDILVNPQTGAMIAQNVPAAGAGTGAAPEPSVRGAGLVPRGYRLRPDGTMEPIPGGPFDPNTIRSQAEARSGGQVSGRTQVERANQSSEITNVISELEKVLSTSVDPKTGRVVPALIDQSTGSGLGALVDIGTGFFGLSTPGAVAVGRLQPIADIVLKIVPRFEGPQSDKDTASYKEAAGKLADATVPNAIRRAAAEEILRVLRDRKGRLGSAVVSLGGADNAPAATPPSRTPAPAAGTGRPPAAGTSRAPAAGVDRNNPLLK